MSEIVSRDVRVDWAAILVGAVTATAIGVILSTFGIGLGLTVNSPYEGEGVSPALFAFGAGVWILAIQILAFWIGGYVCARLRARQTDVSQHEVDVRDGLHGIAVWAVGVLAAGAISFATIGATTAATEAADRGSVAASVSAAVDNEVDQAAAREAVTDREASDESAAERKAEVVRKLAVISAFITAASLLVGAAVAFFAAGVGGHHRDNNVHLKFFVLRRDVRNSMPAPPPSV